MANPPMTHWTSEEINDPHNFIHKFFQLIDDGDDTELLQLLEYIKFYKDTAAASMLERLTLRDNECVQGQHFLKERSPQFLNWLWSEGICEDEIDWAAVPSLQELGKTLMPDVSGQKLTGLMHAAKHGLADVARIILEECEPDLSKEGTVIIENHTIEGASALWCAAGAGHLRVVELLVEAGADVNQT